MKHLLFVLFILFLTSCSHAQLTENQWQQLKKEDSLKNLIQSYTDTANKLIVATTDTVKKKQLALESEKKILNLINGELAIEYEKMNDIKAGKYAGNEERIKQEVELDEGGLSAVRRDSARIMNAILKMEK